MDRWKAGSVDQTWGEAKRFSPLSFYVELAMSEREIAYFKYHREYIPTLMAEDDTCYLCVLTGDQIEILSNLLNYAHRRTSWNDETIDSERYYMPDNDTWDVLEEIIDDLEFRLMSKCDYVTLDDANKRIGINNDTPAAALDALSDDGYLLLSADGERGLTIQGADALLVADDSITLDSSHIHIQNASDNVLNIIEQVGGGKVGVGVETFAANGARLETVDGITFPATQVAKLNVNTLDDYEEGTFDVTMVCATSGTITLDVKTLSYTKIGRVVHISGYLHVSGVSSPVGGPLVGPLPFSCAAGNQFSSGVAVLATGMAAGAITSIVGMVLNGGTSLYLYQFAAGNVSYCASNIQAGTTFYISISYFSAT